LLRVIGIIKVCGFNVGRIANTAPPGAARGAGGCAVQVSDILVQN